MTFEIDLAGILPAIFGLVGVIVGGTITGGSTYFFERRRERRELKRASRLLDEELLIAETAATMCVEQRKWWPREDVELTTEAWREYRGVIALELSYAAWRAVSLAFMAVGHLATAGRENGDLNDRVVESLRPMLRDIKAGRSALAPLFLEAGVRLAK